MKEVHFRVWVNIDHVWFDYHELLLENGNPEPIVLFYLIQLQLFFNERTAWKSGTDFSFSKRNTKFFKFV